MHDDAEYVVEATRLRTPVIVELVLHPIEQAPLEFRPGQYVLLNDVGYRVPPRSYSIANAPRFDGAISLLVTKVDGGARSGWAHQLRVADTVAVSGPYGTFVADPATTRPVLYLAAGSGLAPARALAEAAWREHRLDQSMLIMSARTESDVIDADRFRGCERQCPGFTFLRTLTRASGPPPVGRLPALLPGLVPDLGEREVFVSGAPGFVRACADLARDHGVPGVRLHTEEFFHEPSPWTSQPPGPSSSA